MTRRPRILVTRAPHQASELADALRALGAEPILIPTIELAAPTTFALLDNALASLPLPPDQGGFHWLLFTSANAVEAFHRRVELVQDATPPGSSTRAVHCAVRVAAIGPATARALAAIGLTPDLIPPKAVAESFAEALVPEVRQAGGGSKRFLLVRAEQARDHLPDTLRNAGAEVTIAPAYRTIIPASSVEAIRQLFSSPETCPHAITFTSSSTVTNLLALLEAANLPLPPTILRASIGPITSATLREAGYPPQTESPEATTSALAQNVVKTCSLKYRP